MSNEASTVGEDHGWQQRAITAETQAKELEAKLAEANNTLLETQATLSGAGRKHEIEVELMRADAIDLDATRILIESAMSQSMIADVWTAVAGLKRSKPFLFRNNRAPISGMSPIGKHVSSALTDVANEARTTGDRRTLLNYLRAKRGF